MLSVLAHNVGADSLPAPSWLLGYLGALAVLGAAAWLRSGWPTARLAVAAEEAPAPRADDAPAEGSLARPGQVAGLVLLVLTIVVALAGSNEAAVSPVPRGVFRVWLVGFPLVCLLLGDVMRWINPFAPVVALVEKVTGRRGDPTDAPPWTAAVLFVAFTWVYLAFHDADSPRVVGATVLAYSLVAIAGGVRWGRGWLATGEAFGAISTALARLTHRAAGPPTPGLLPLGVVWLGAAAFDGLSVTDWWVEVLGTNVDWSRTFLNTVGLVWMTSIVAAATLITLRVAEADPAGGHDAADQERPRTSLAVLVGLAVVPMAAAWFLTDNLPVLIAEGQDFIVQVADPLDRGWNLFGGRDFDIDYSRAQGDWIRWVQLIGLLAGHVGAVVLAHDGALARLGRRRGMRVTWTVAGAAAVSFVAAALVVLG